MVVKLGAWVTVFSILLLLALAQTGVLGRLGYWAAVLVDESLRGIAPAAPPAAPAASSPVVLT